MLNKRSRKTSHRHRSPAARSHDGFTLIEVLIAVLIFAVGLLGVASLQITGMRLTKDSGSIGQAALLATSLAERMRLNISSIDDCSGAACSIYSSATGTEKGCVAAVCTPEDMAEQDVFAWKQNIAAALPGGSGTVTMDGNGLHVIYIRWLETADAENGTTAAADRDAARAQSYTMRVFI